VNLRPSENPAAPRRGSGSLGCLTSRAYATGLLPDAPTGLECEIRLYSCFQNNSTRDIARWTIRCSDKPIKLRTRFKGSNNFKITLVYPPVDSALDKNGDYPTLSCKASTCSNNKLTLSTQNDLRSLRIEIFFKARSYNHTSVSRQVGLLTTTNLRVDFVARIFTTNDKHFEAPQEIR
jgi:hypothetical protein